MLPAPRFALALALASLCLAACGNPCRDVAAQICSCQPDETSRQLCRNRARDAEQFAPVRSQDEAFCQSLLDANTCDCNNLATPEGRFACGLAYTLPKRAGDGAAGK